MKTRWWVTACVTVALALACGVAVAQDRGQNRNDQGRGNDKNRGQSQRNENRGQTKKRYRRFNQRQQQAARNYYNQHQNKEVFRPDSRWNDDYERRIQPGYVLDDDMRRMSRPAPIEMTRGFGPAPRGYRYVVIGPHVVLIDSGYRVHDAIHFEINIGH
jgi:hypothetical protein